MKDIKGYEGRYAITKNGRIWSYSRIIIRKNKLGNFRIQGRWLKPMTSKNKIWYHSVTLGNRGFKVHRLVSQTYIPNPLNLLEVNHKNGKKNDNRVENLEWCTRKQNLEHGLKICPLSKRHLSRDSKEYWPKLTSKQVLQIREEYSNRKTTYRKLAKKYNVSPVAILKIIHRIIWKYI